MLHNVLWVGLICLLSFFGYGFMIGLTSKLKGPIAKFLDWTWGADTIFDAVDDKEEISWLWPFFLCAAHMTFTVRGIYLTIAGPILGGMWLMSIGPKIFSFKRAPKLPRAIVLPKKQEH